ncbi:MAG: MarR family winged helix-turn-helix transcriptional regulator [Gemmatimonadaceae bacterium]
MTPDLRAEIKQTRPFASLEEECYLNLERTTAVVGHAFAEAMKAHGITPTQYNVLRILRGAGEGGLCRHEIRDRLVAQVPDVTRLLDRMEDAGLVERARDSEDRRLVTTRITRAGLKLLRTLDAPVLAMHEQTLGHLSDGQLRQLIELLALAREGGERRDAAATGVGAQSGSRSGRANTAGR